MASKKPETLFWENRVKPELEKFQEPIFFERIQQVAIRGTPDVLICFRGRFIGWEMKVPPNKVGDKSLQRHKLNQIEFSGGIAREVTPDNLHQMIEELLCLSSL